MVATMLFSTVVSVAGASERYNYGLPSKRQRISEEDINEETINLIRQILIRNQIIVFLDENGIKIVSTAEVGLDGRLDYSNIRRVKYEEKYRMFKKMYPAIKDLTK